jgi:hypothetical protein
MTRNWRRAVGLSIAMALAGVGGVSSANDAVKESNKWRLAVDGSAESAGKVDLKVTPHEGTPTQVSVAVADKRHENEIARDIRDALAAQLPVDRYKIEVDDGEDVLIKRLSGQPDFTVELVSSGMQGVKLKLKRE